MITGVELFRIILDLAELAFFIFMVQGIREVMRTRNRDED
jgi:hypothetical protein